MIGYVSPTDLAWAAGFFDGEGNVGATIYAHWRGNAQHRHINARIGQVDREVLDKFRAIVGVGTVAGPFIRINEHRAPMHDWRCGNIRDVHHVFALLQPYLGSVKRAQFKQAFETYENHQLTKQTTAQRRQAISQYLSAHPGMTQEAIADHSGS